MFQRFPSDELRCMFTYILVSVQFEPIKVFQYLCNKWKLLSTRIKKNFSIEVHLTFEKKLDYICSFWFSIHVHYICILIYMWTSVLHERKNEKKNFLPEFMFLKLFKSKLKNIQIAHGNQYEFKHMKLFKIKVCAVHNVNISYWPL